MFPESFVAKNAEAQRGQLLCPGAAPGGLQAQARATSPDCNAHVPPWQPCRPPTAEVQVAPGNVMKRRLLPQLGGWGGPVGGHRRGAPQGLVLGRHNLGHNPFGPSLPFLSVRSKRWSGFISPKPPRHAPAHATALGAASRCLGIRP